jgi:hypothetical protein
MATQASTINSKTGHNEDPSRLSELADDLAEANAPLRVKGPSIWQVLALLSTELLSRLLR